MRKLSFVLLFFTMLSQAQIVNIPDANFKSRLLMANSNSNWIAGVMNPEATAYFLGETIDTNADGEIQFSEAQRIHYLDVSTYVGPYSISSIVGIEAFTNLRLLKCNVNAIATIDVSSLSQLWTLNCSDNLISSIDLHGMGQLKTLLCSGNSLTALDFSPLPNIESVNCADNQITTLDFSANPNFYDLATANNSQLTSINIKNGRTQNTTLGIYQCDGFGNCPNLTSICADENEISSLQQMVSYTLPNQDITILDCLLSSQGFVNDATIKIFPNPTPSSLTITSNAILKSLELLDMQGRLLVTKPLHETQTDFDISSYHNGIYFLKITTDAGSKVEKIIKE